MSNLNNALQQLRQEHKQSQQQTEKLHAAISMLEDLVGRNGSAPASNGARPGRIVSATARKRMAQAQKARWAKSRQESHPAAGGKAGTTPAKRTISASTRRKIAAAQKARWAKVRAAA